MAATALGLAIIIPPLIPSGTGFQLLLGLGLFVFFARVLGRNYRIVWSMMQAVIEYEIGAAGS